MLSLTPSTRISLVCALVFAVGSPLAFGQAPPAQPAKTPPANTAQTPSAKTDSEKLPANFKPPRSIPPVMTEGKELTTDAKSKSLGVKLTRADKYTIVFSNAKLDDATKAIVQEWAEWRFHEMTLKSKRKRLHEVRADLMRDIGYAGRSPGVPKKDVEAFRYYFCDEVTKRAAELLDNNFHVRLNAAIVLAQLNLTDYDRRKEIKEQAYVKAALPLLEVIQAKTGGGMDEQLEAVKVQAAIGLGRINLLGPPADLNISVKGQNLRSVVAKALIAELKDLDTHPWYQKRLIDALASIDMVNDVTTGKPIILQQLGEVLADRDRHPSVRARAARGLGRCPLPAGVNTEKLIFQILLLESEMAAAYQKKPNDYHWHDSFADLYYAFHPASEDEIALFGSKRPPGLLRKQQQLGTIVPDAFTEILPITKAVVEQPGWRIPKETGVRLENSAMPGELISNLAKWLQDHQPATHELAPGLPELAPTAPTPTEKVGTTTGS